MSQLTVRIATPHGLGVPEVPRAFEVTGSLTVQFSPGAGPLTSKSVSVQFGDGGPVQGATFLTATTWHCIGQPNANVPPGAAVNVIVTASGTVRFFHIKSEPDFEHVEANASLVVRIANPPPQLTIDAFPSDVTAAQLPFVFPLSGSTTDPDANTSSVQCALDTGSFEPVDNPAGNWSRWSKTFNLGRGLHRFTVRAVDLGGNQIQQERFLTVHLAVEPPDPGAASVTSWTRLEPRCRDADMGGSMGARVFDPLWLMARQWQIGEFQAADAGTPVQARVRATSAMLSRCHLGDLPANTNAQAPRYDPSRIPLEAMVERRRMRAVDANDPSMLTLAIEAGLHFLRMLEPPVLTKSYRAALIARFALQPLASVADEATLRFVQGMAGRAPDARLLATTFRASDGVAQLTQDPALQIAVPDRDKLGQAAAAWVAWYDGLFAEPAGPADEAWMPSRLAYALTVSGSFSDQPSDQINLAANPFDGGRLDWSSFDCDFEVNMNSNNDHAFTATTETTIPAPVNFRGAPAVRFWELEDSRLAYGLVPVGPTDLAHMMMIEYASSYGNDWFVVPITLPVGSVNRVDSLVVTDSFGVRTLLKPIGTRGMPARNFSMWQHANLRRPGEAAPGYQPNLFFLPPVIGQVMESAALEDVLFMRDEMANIAWAIERSVETATEQPRIYSTPLPSQDDATQPTAGAVPRYLLSSTVPGNWIPLLPVRLKSGQGKTIMRLKRGAVLQPDGSQIVHPAQGQALNVGSDLLLFDAEVPREGVHVTRARRTSRWIDGSTFVWTAFRKQVGRGEGSSGLRFDQLVGPDAGQR